MVATNGIKIEFDLMINLKMEKPRELMPELVRQPDAGN